jgi:hypothetical protein
MSDFNDPGTGGGDNLKLDALNGALLLFDVKGYEERIATTFGDKSAVRADVAVLDGPNKGETYVDTFVFPLVMQGQLRGSIGAKVIGRLGQGVAKPGQKPPWTLAAATDADKDIGRRYLAHVQAQAVEQTEPF